MKEPKIQRITFEEIQEFYPLDLIDYPYNPGDPGDPFNTLMLIYDTDTKSFIVAPVNTGGSDVTIENAKLTADITANPDFDWVIDKNFVAGMSLQQVMEQLLSPPVPATATIGSTPSIIDAWNSQTILIKLIYDKGSKGALESVTGTYDGAALNFTVVSLTEANATIPSGAKTLNDGEHYRALSIVADVTHYNDATGIGTSTFQTTGTGGLASTVVYGKASSSTVSAIETAVTNAIDGILTNTTAMTARVAPSQKGPTIHYTPIANSKGYHWMASTRPFTKWEQKDFQLNNGTIIDTHRTTSFTTKNVNYYIYTTVNETTYDAVTLIFK